MIGVPLVVLFQQFIRQRPLQQLWVRDAAAFRLGLAGIVVAVLLILAAALPAAAAAGFGNAWQVALGVVFVSGVLFLILSLIGLRELIFNSISPSLKNGIAAGIGLFVAFIGLQQATVIVKDSGHGYKNEHALCVA